MVDKHIQENLLYPPNTPKMRGLVDMKEYLLDNCGCGVAVIINGFMCESVLVLSKAFVIIHLVDILQCSTPRISLIDQIAEINKNVKGLEHIQYGEGWSNSFDELKEFGDESIDFLFLDGNTPHGMLKQNIINWYPKVKMGGYIGGRNYDKNKYHHMGEVTRVVEQYLSPIDKIFRGGLFLKKKLRRILV